MVIQSIVIGSCLGIIWGLTFTSKLIYKKAKIALSTVSTIFRYFLLTAILILLIQKNLILLSWGTLSFLGVFWLILLRATLFKSRI